MYPFSMCLQQLNGNTQVDPTDASLLITEPYFNLPKLQEIYDQFVFEEYEFKSYYRCTRMLLFDSSSLRSPN